MKEYFGSTVSDKPQTYNAPSIYFQSFYVKVNKKKIIIQQLLSTSSISPLGINFSANNCLQNNA